MLNPTATYVSVPLPGFSGLRPLKHYAERSSIRVSVPLPGFSGLRPGYLNVHRLSECRFSPVAGIQWVETTDRPLRGNCTSRFQSRCRDSVG